MGDLVRGPAIFVAGVVLATVSQILLQEPQVGLKQLVTRYGEAWEEQDVNALSNVFTTDALYQERAFKRPLRGVAEIRQYWEHKVVRQQANIHFRIISLLELLDGKMRSLREYWRSSR